MTEDQGTAIDNLRSGNYQLSELMKDTVHNALVKNKQLLEDAEDVDEVLSAIKVVETAGKITGLSPKETQTNISLNAVVGFDFIEVNADDLLQLSQEDDFEEALLDED